MPHFVFCDRHFSITASFAGGVGNLKLIYVPVVVKASVSSDVNISDRVASAPGIEMAIAADKAGAGATRCHRCDVCHRSCSERSGVSIGVNIAGAPAVMPIATAAESARFIGRRL